MDHHPPIECPFCGENGVRFWFAHDSVADRKTYPLYSCEGCGSSFVYPRPSNGYLATFYAGGQNSLQQNQRGDTEAEIYDRALQEEVDFPNSTVDAERIARLARKFGTGKRLLDIGAGYGFFSRAAGQQGFEVTALEINDASRRIFRQMNRFEAMPLMLDDSMAGAYAGEFDVVLLSQVLEHIPDVDDAVRQIRTLLRPGGLCVIAVPHFRSWLSRLQGKRDMFICPPEHLNFFTVDGMQRLFSRHGFHCQHMHTVSRLDARKVKRRIGVPVAGAAFVHALNAGMQGFDRMNLGMFINAYFVAPDASHVAASMQRSEEMVSG